MEQKYTSKYNSSRKITAAAYLTEFILERQAKREKTTLPLQYWSHPEWNKQFKHQIICANKLLKEYSCLQIINALKTKRGESIYSLGNKKPIKELVRIQTVKTTLKNIKGSIKDIYKENKNFIDDTDIFTIAEEISKIPQEKNLWEKLS